MILTRINYAKFKRGPLISYLTEYFCTFDLAFLGKCFENLSSFSSLLDSINRFDHLFKCAWKCQRRLESDEGEYKRGWCGRMSVCNLGAVLSLCWHIAKLGRSFCHHPTHQHVSHSVTEHWTILLYDIGIFSKNFCNFRPSEA